MEEVESRMHLEPSVCKPRNGNPDGSFISGEF